MSKNVGVDQKERSPLLFWRISLCVLREKKERNILLEVGRKKKMFCKNH